MKATLLALVTAVLALSACTKNDEAARQAETFTPNDRLSGPSYSAPSSSSSYSAPDRVGVDVDVDRTNNGVKVDADGYRVDSRGQRIGSTTAGDSTVGERIGDSVDSAASDIKGGVDRFGKRVGEGLDDMGDSAQRGVNNVTGYGTDVKVNGKDVDVDAKSDMVGDLDLGRTLNSTGDVADRTQQFKVGDSIVASIDADNLSSGGSLTATLKTKAGKVIATDKATFSAGKENAVFRLGNAPAAGDYVITISSANGEVESQSFSIHN